jgi:VWFA-related protein
MTEVGLGKLLSAVVAFAVVAGVVRTPTHARATSQASQPPADAPASTTSGSSLRTLRFEAIITDAAGAPVSNLDPSQLTVVVDEGVKVPVDGLEWRSNIPAPVGPVEPLAPVANAVDEARAAKDQGVRVIAVYLDEYHVAAESTERVRAAAQHFLDNRVRPQDLLVVMRPLDHLSDILFTRDRAKARQSIESFTGRRDDYTPRTPFEEQYLGRTPAAVRAARAQIVMSGVRALATRMGDLGGSLGGLVLVSGGFSTQVPRARERRLPDLQGLSRVAGRARLFFYTFNPESFPAVAASATDASPDAPVDLSEVLRTVARQTGGETVAAGQDLTVGFDRVSKDLDGYYVVTFSPKIGNDGRFHPIVIASTRRDTRVRTRGGYWAPLQSELRAGTPRVTPLPSLLPTRPLRRSPWIDSWFGLTADANGSRNAIFTWMPSSAPPAGRGARPIARPDVVALKVTTLAGAVLFDGEIGSARTAAGNQRPRRAVFPAAPGRLQLDLTILQADGTRLDVGALDFDVPTVRGSTPVILQPQVFGATSAREFRDLSTDVNAAPLPGREFRRTEHLLLRVPTFEPAGKAVQVSARLMNRTGAAIATLTPMPEESSATLSQFDLPLARFAPGEYSIEVAAKSDAGIARELIRFKITG